MTRAQTYQLIDCREAFSKNGKQRSCVPLLGSIGPGSTVKIGFVPEINRKDSSIQAEWMWVKITEVIEPGIWIGMLDNRPTMCPSLALGDEICFEARHVYEVESK